MLIPATVEDIQSHIQSAIELVHPLHEHGSRLPLDVQDAVRWVVQRGTSVAAERNTRLRQLASIQSSLDGWEKYLWKEGVADHVKAMIAYKPRLAFLHALVVALEWPFRDLVLNMAVGFAPVGMQPDTGVWRLSLSLSYIITRVAPHCVNTLRILPLSLSLSYIYSLSYIITTVSPLSYMITRVAPHCVNTLRILHAAYDATNTTRPLVNTHSVR